MYMFTIDMVLLHTVLIFADHSDLFNMEGNCGGTVYMNEFNMKALKLRPCPWPRYKPNMNCLMTFQTVSTERLHVVFSRLEIEFEPYCDHDFLTVYDGNDTSAEILPGLERNICGYEEPNGAFASSGSSISVLFKSDSYENEDGFDLIITSFHDGPCRENEFECDDHRCIDKELQCDGHDNCGDLSDECRLSTEVLAGIIASVLFVTALAIFVSTVVQRKKNSKKERNIKEKSSIKSISSSTTDKYVIERSDSLFPEDGETPNTSVANPNINVLKFLK